MTLGVYTCTSRSFIDCNLFSNGMICNCKISTDSRVVLMQSLCNSRASYWYAVLLVWQWETSCKCTGETGAWWTDRAVETQGNGQHSRVAQQDACLERWWELITFVCIVCSVCLNVRSQCQWQHDSRAQKRFWGGLGGHSPLSKVWPPMAPQMKFLVSVTGHLGWTFSDYMWVLCQKLHNCTYDRQCFSGDQPPCRDPWPSKVEVLEPPLVEPAARLASLDWWN